MRYLSDAFDKLTAIAGVAKVAGELLQSRYIFGIWHCDLLRGLLWNSRRYNLVANRVFKQRPLSHVERGAPTWSWAAYEGPILGSEIVYYPQQVDALYWNPENHCSAILEVTGVPDSYDQIRAMSSPTTAAQIRIRGVLHAVHLNPDIPEDYLVDVGGKKRWHSGRPEGRLAQLEASEVTTGLAGQRHHVAFGAFDTWSSGGVTSFVCLRLVTRTIKKAGYQGLILLPDGGGRYRRIGVFSVVDEDYFKTGEPEEVVII